MPGTESLPGTQNFQNHGPAGMCPKKHNRPDDDDDDDFRRFAKLHVLTPVPMTLTMGHGTILPSAEFHLSSRSV